MPAKNRNKNQKNCFWKVFFQLVRKVNALWQENATGPQDRRQVFWLVVCLATACLLSCMSLQPDSSETSSMARWEQEVVVVQLPRRPGTRRPSSSISGKLAENLDVILQKEPFSFFIFFKGRKKRVLECGKWFPVELGDSNSTVCAPCGPSCRELHEQEPHSLRSPLTIRGRTLRVLPTSAPVVFLLSLHGYICNSMVL